MATLEEIVLKYTAETELLKAEMKTAVTLTQQSTDLMSKAIDKMAKDSEQKSKGMGDVLKTAFGTALGITAVAAANAAKDAIVAFGKAVIVDGVQAAAEAEAASNSLAQALGRAGQYSIEAMNDLKEFGAEMQRTTKYEDDAVIGAAGLIESLARLDKEGLQGATQAAANMASALGMDLDSAATTVAKAIEGNVGALGRYGIKVEEGKDKAETMTRVLDALNQRFGGAAQGEINTYAGALAKAKNMFGEVTENIGNAVVKNQAVILVINAVSKVFEKLSKYIEENQQTIKTWVAGGIVGAVMALQTMMTVLDGATAMVKTLGQIFIEVGKGIGATMSAIVQAMKGDFQGAFDTITAQVKDSGKQIGEAFTNETVFAQVNEQLEGVADAAAEGFALVSSGAEAATAPVNNATNAVKDLTAAQLKMKEMATEIAEQYKNDDSAQAKYDREAEGLQLAFEQRLITEEEMFAQLLELKSEQASQEQELLDEARAQNLITETQHQQGIIGLAQNTALQLEAIEVKRLAAEKKMREENLKNASTFFGNLTSLAGLGSKELGGIAKGAAIAQATIDGYAAIQKAWAQGGFFGGPVMAAGVAIATAANIAKIAATPLASGIDEVPGMGTRDNFPAMLAPGERVVPRETNQDLKGFLQDQGQKQPIQINVTVTTGDILDSTQGAARIIDMVNDGIQAGMKIVGGGMVAQ